MSTLRVDTITNEAGNGPPNFPNGLAVSLLAPLAGSTANALLLDLTTPVAGTQISFVPTDPNTGAVTINGEPALTVTGAAMPAGYLLAGEVTEATWDGASWIVGRAIVQGSNTNGYFVQFENGLQITTSYVTVIPVANVATVVTFPYPHPFAAPPAPTSNTDSALGAALQAWHVSDTTASDYNVRVLRTNTTNSRGYVNAVGNWY